MREALRYLNNARDILNFSSTAEEDWYFVIFGVRPAILQFRSLQFVDFVYLVYLTYRVVDS